jgi:phosphatidylglycerol---prolipoprotein diacylglyceryl transferase
MSSAPLFPYVTLPELTLLPAEALGGFPSSPLSLKPFGVLVATGVYLGAYLALRRARKLGIEPRAMTSFITWVVGIGFVGGHVFDLLFYYPERLVEEPLALLKLWDGLSSFGGFLGAAIGAAWWRQRHRVPMLPYADTVMALLPVGWMFGRMGCASVHDHPGVRSEAWLAVRFPGGARFDLGLLELLYVLPIAALFLWLGRKRRPWGYFVALACVCYAPVRFGLDFLRERAEAAGEVTGALDPRYLGLTPAQWGCFVLFGLGAGLLWRVSWAAARGEGFGPAQVPDAFRVEPAPNGSGAH